MQWTPHWSFPCQCSFLFFHYYLTTTLYFIFTNKGKITFFLAFYNFCNKITIYKSYWKLQFKLINSHFYWIPNWSLSYGKEKIKHFILAIIKGHKLWYVERRCASSIIYLHTHALLSSVSSQHFNFMFCLSCINYFCCNVSEAFFRKMLPLLFMCNSKKSLSLPRLKVKINTSQTKKGTANKVTQKKQDPRLGQCN